VDEPQTLRTLGSSSTLRVPAFDVPARGAAADLTGELQRARRELDAGRHVEQVPVLRVFENSEVPLSLDYASYEDGLIEDAKANIAAGHIELALAQLDEVLDRVPGHHEARYLRSYCLLSGGQEMAALTELESLRADQPEPELAGKVLQLRATLRGRLTGRLVAEQDEDALAGYLRLVPEEGRCWLELTLLRARSSDLPGAVATAQVGARAADEEAHRRVLGRLSVQLRLALLRARVLRVPALLHEGAYDAALEELRQLGPDWNGFQPVADLAAYIVQMWQQGPGRPDLPRDRADVVYDLLAGSDLARAAALLNEGQPESGLALVQRSIRLAPTDPFTNFMLGCCLLITDGDLDEIEAAARVADTDERLVKAGELLDIVALRRVNQEVRAIHKFVGNLSNCPIARIEKGLQRTQTLRTHAEGLLRTIGEPFRDQLRACVGVLAENAVQLDLALVSRELARVLHAGWHRGARAELDEIIRRCAALRRATREADTRQVIGEIEQAAWMAREQA
jgi:tetratricopeptide (TPR) repeat protein